MASFLFKLKNYLFSSSSFEYNKWIREVERHTFKVDISSRNLAKLITIVLVLPQKQDEKLIKHSIDSIYKQSASNWKIIVVSNDSLDFIEALSDERITLFKPNNNLIHFRSLANSSIGLLEGCYATFIQAGDELSLNFVQQLNICLARNPSIKLVVTDEDYLDKKGQRTNPFFKPDWNPDYLLNYNYLSKAVIYHRDLFNKLGGFNCDAKEPYHELALASTKDLESSQIGHIDKVLFHFRSALNKPIRKVEFPLPKLLPLVTIIIPNKDNLELLSTCLDGVLNNTTYNNFEVIVVDNQSSQLDVINYLQELNQNPNVKVLHYDKPFNYSDINNRAVSEAKGELLCFLNNDIEIVKPDWLSEMVSHACRPDIGCVGAKLLYPDGTIQHAGVTLGLKGYASHAHKGFDRNSTGYFNRLVVAHNVSAVTAACMVVRKNIFDEVSGFDAEHLKVAYNDVDFCLKVQAAGYRNLFTPHAELIHHESKSRGKKRNKNQQAQLKEESEFLKQKWQHILYSDPAYNKNLTLLREDFSLDSSLESIRLKSSGKEL